MLYAKAADYRRGSGMKKSAEEWLRFRGVKNVASFADVLMPGF